MKKGFTLVEIMIVVAIIGIIIAIAVPAFLRARENSRGRACQENLTKIDGSKEQYALEFKAANGDTVSMAELLNPNGSGVGTGYMKREPVCPGGGAYDVREIGSDPECDATPPSWAVQHTIPQG
jgi:prepilin-type N-terminal cleavage/methylation domain-containing protein